MVIGDLKFCDFGLEAPETSAFPKADTNQSLFHVPEDKTHQAHLPVLEIADIQGGAELTAGEHLQIVLGASGRSSRKPIDGNTIPNFKHRPSLSLEAFRQVGI